MQEDEIRRGALRQPWQTPAVAVLALLATIESVPRTSTQSGAIPLPVGSVSRAFVPQRPYNWRGARTHALVTQVWYPAAPGARMERHWLGPPESPWFSLGSWSEGAPVSEGRFPLVVLSHGTGGSATMLGWWAQALAERGFVVAAVNHPGNNALEPYTAEGFLLWWERARDLSTTIDHLLVDRELSAHIDPRRIGAGGFSLGGYSVLALAGARTDPDAFRAYCRSRTGGSCPDPDEFPGLFAQWDSLEKTSPEFLLMARQAGAQFRDPRIRAVFALAPALGPALVTNSLNRVLIPVSVVAGERDTIADAESNARRISARLPAGTLTVLPGAGHYTFLASCTDRGREARPDLCADAIGVDRNTAHRRVGELATQFFSLHLKPVGGGK